MLIQDNAGDYLLDNAGDYIADNDGGSPPTAGGSTSLAARRLRLLACWLVFALILLLPNP